MTTQGDSRSPSLEELLRMAVTYHLEEVHTTLPGRIVKFDPVDQRAEVQPLIERLIETEDGGEICETLPPITDVPVQYPRTKKFVISFPLEPGDLVTLHFTERSIDKWLGSKDGDIINPDDFLRHDLSSAIAVPGVYPFSLPIKNFDNEAVTIGLQDGTIVRVKEGLIELGAKGSTDKISRDSKVQTELNALRTTVNNFILGFNGHGHSAFGSPPTTVPPNVPAVSQPPIASTASDLVTLEK